MRSAANDSVPNEEVWMGNLVEQLEGVRHGERDRDSGAEDELTQGGGVGEEAPDDHEAMDLPESAETPAPWPDLRVLSLPPRLPDHLFPFINFCFFSLNCLMWFIIQIYVLLILCSN